MHNVRLLCGLALLVSLAACSAGPSATAPASAPKPGPTAAPPSPPTAAPAAAVPAQPTAVSARQPLSPRVPVRFAHLGQASDAGVYIGLERGYFAEEGI